MPIAMASSKYYCLMLSMVVAVGVCMGDDAYICTRATFYGSPDCNGNPTGACGYGEYGRTVNNGGVTGVHRLFRNGSGCGSCYQVRCKIPAYCKDEGTEVVATDFGVAGHYADFILSPRAYANLAKPNTADQLFAYGVVDVEYRRVPCRYTTNLVFKVHDRSCFPSYLAIFPIYQAGTSDITSLQIWLEDCKEWRDMRRVFGTVWDVQNPPTGAAISLRMQVVNGDDTKWIQLTGVIASDWKAGAMYDAAVQLN